MEKNIHSIVNFRLKQTVVFCSAIILSLGLLWHSPVHAANGKKKQKKPTVASPTEAMGLRVNGLALQVDGKTSFAAGLEAPGLYRLPAAQQAAFFTQAKNAGVEMVKTNAFSLGRVAMPIQTGPGKWDEGALSALDGMVAAAGKTGIKLVLDLCADSGPEGGKETYASWVGSSNPGVFFLDYGCKAWYQRYVRMLLARVNKVTGSPYSKDPTIWAFNLIDAPAYPGGEGAIANQWVSTMANFVKGLGTTAKIVLALDPTAPGLSGVELAGQPGVDFVMEEMVANAPSPALWAPKIGKPVLQIVGNAQAATPGSTAGSLLSMDPTATFNWALLKKTISTQTLAFTPSSAGLFTGLSASPAGDAVVDWDASESIAVTLAAPAQVTIRYGEKGLLNTETTPTPEKNTSYLVQLKGLSTGTRYAYQVKAVGSTAVQFSNIQTFDTPILKRLVVSPSPMTRNFITVRGTQFYDGEKPFRFVGTNNYYLHYMPDSIEYIMSEAEKMGFTVMRTWAFGESSKPVPDDWEKLRYFQVGPGQFVESNLKLLDKVVASAAKHHIRLVLALSNNWNDFGGAPQWVKWYGSPDKNDFFDNPAIEKGYQDYMAAIVNRVNTLTGVAYKDDPTIFAWDLMNEPRDEKDKTGTLLVAWIDQMAMFLKKQGVKQLVTTGSEGLRAVNGTHYSGTDFIRDHQSPAIDYAVFHVYPTMNGSGWNMTTISSILSAYVKDAHEVLKKPVVMEEFGIEKGKPGRPQAQYIYGMMSAFYADGGDGCGYWMLEEPHYSGDANCFSPDDTDIVNLFVLQSKKMTGGN